MYLGTYGRAMNERERMGITARGGEIAGAYRDKYRSRSYILNFDVTAVNTIRLLLNTKIDISGIEYFAQRH